MATLKHLGSKNADYGAAEQYLLFEHDEFTMKPVLDENGRLIPREDYRLSTLNCGGEDFAVACMRSNLRYEKNQRREDVKSHHYKENKIHGYSINALCKLGKVSRVAYYKWLNRKIPANETENNHIVDIIENIHSEHPDKGYRRIRDDLERYHNIKVIGVILRRCWRQLTYR